MLWTIRSPLCFFQSFHKAAVKTKKYALQCLLIQNGPSFRAKGLQCRSSVQQPQSPTSRRSSRTRRGLAGPTVRRRGSTKHPPARGGDRVYRDFLEVRFSATKLRTEGAIFTTGSCFARNIERAFVAANMRVASWTPGCGIPQDHMQRYNCFSILQDFKWALNGGYEGASVQQSQKGPFFDFTGYGRFVTRDEAIAARQRVIDLHGNVRQADALIVTLGLVEAWYDRELSIWLNQTPYGLLAQDPDRYECRITNYQENSTATQEIVETVRSVNPQLKIIVTVSPVPLVATFSGQDVVEANMYSKCTLRAVAGDLVARNKDTYYFPSYEMVNLSDPHQTWMPDRRHVRPEVVAKVVARFKEEFY